MCVMWPRCEWAGNVVVGKLKDLVKRETNIPETKQELHGWLHKNDAFIKDSVRTQVKLPVLLFIGLGNNKK